LRPQLEGGWYLETGGNNFLPWKNKPWRGQAAIIGSAVGATATFDLPGTEYSLVVSCNTKIIIMHVQTYMRNNLYVYV